MPDDLAAALGANPPAREHWDAFSRSPRRAILEWIAQAKRPETRARRIAEAADARGSQRAAAAVPAEGLRPTPAGAEGSRRRRGSEWRLDQRRRPEPAGRSVATRTTRATTLIASSASWSDPDPAASAPVVVSVVGGVTCGVVVEPPPGATVGVGVAAATELFWMLAEQTSRLPPPLAEPLHWLIEHGEPGGLRARRSADRPTSVPPLAEPLHWVIVAPEVVAGKGSQTIVGRSPPIRPIRRTGSR